MTPALSNVPARGVSARVLTTQSPAIPRLDWRDAYNFAWQYHEAEGPVIYSFKMRRTPSTSASANNEWLETSSQSAHRAAQDYVL